MVAHNEWGAYQSGFAQDYDFRYHQTYPIFPGCRQWSDAEPSGTTNYKIKTRLYIESSSASDMGFDGSVNGASIDYNWTSPGTVHWSQATLEVAKETDAGPIGEKFAGTESSLGVARGNLRWESNEAFPKMLTMEMGCLNDKAYASTGDGYADRLDRYTYEKYEDKQPACSWMVSNGVLRQLNTFSHEATWHLSWPMFEQDYTE